MKRKYGAERLNPNSNWPSHRLGTRARARERESPQTSLLNFSTVWSVYYFNFGRANRGRLTLILSCTVFTMAIKRPSEWRLAICGQSHGFILQVSISDLSLAAIKWFIIQMKKEARRGDMWYIAVCIYIFRNSDAESGFEFKRNRWFLGKDRQRATRKANQLLRKLSRLFCTDMNQNIQV